MSDKATIDIAPWRLFAVGAIPGSVIAAGILLLAGSALPSTRPNPYAGLFLLLGGIGLAVTVLRLLKARYGK